MTTPRDLVGTYNLVSLEVRTKDNQAIIDPRFPGSTGLFLWGMSPRGLLIYTEDGHFSACMMHTSRPALSTKDVMDPSTDPAVLGTKQALLATYLSSAGTFEVRGGEVLLHNVKVHLFPNEVGGTQDMGFVLTERRLVTHKATPPIAFLGGQTAVTHSTWERAS
jgi:hypothetical protein